MSKTPQIKVVSIGKVKAYKKNAKVHLEGQIEQIARSIKAFGFLQPIVIEPKTLEIIVGHGRFLAAKTLGFSEIRIGAGSAAKGEKFVPAISAEGLTHAEIKAYRLADNKLNESGWDMPMVVEELKDLQIEGLDITLTGFSDDDLNIFEPVGGSGGEALDQKGKHECPECGCVF